jgi:hypothetical protein
VEANDSPYHFPSPPTSRYGITLPLDRAAPSALREVLHPPLSGEPATRACTGTLGKIAEMPLPDHNSLAALRKRHFSRLGKDTADLRDHAWLDRHAERK